MSGAFGLLGLVAVMYDAGEVAFRKVGVGESTLFFFGFEMCDTEEDGAD